MGLLVMDKRKWRARVRWRVSRLRLVLSLAIFAIALAALFAFPHILLPSNPPLLPMQQEVGYQVSGVVGWTREDSPPVRKLNDRSGSVEFANLWKVPSKKKYGPCTERSDNYSAPAESRVYLIVHTNGGLNQMRAGISDMVTVARIMNATLVVPELDKRSFWQDTSKFSDVFDEEHFINALVDDVKVVKKLPQELAGRTRAVKHFTSWSSVGYYQNEISQLLTDYQVIRAAKSDSRLANNNLPQDFQKLRCRVFYEALRFAPHIEELGKKLVERMRSYGHYIALHLRYEKDMLAFSGCTHGLTKEEADELTKIRENTSYWKVKDIDSSEQRAKGNCPLTPKEVGMFLSALGYPPSTPVYVAAGEIYGRDSQMEDLKSKFPILMNKGILASADELRPFASHASQMAALDYIVSVESDVFVPSYSGNMATAVEGHRRFLGHRKTITPDRKALVDLFDKINSGSLKGGRKLINSGSIKEGRKFSVLVQDLHKRRQGSPRKRKGPVSGTKGKDRFRSEESFYENPFPDCICSLEHLDGNISSAEL